MKKALLASLLLWLNPAWAESVLRRDNGTEPHSIDPQLVRDDAGSAIIYDTFEGLTAFNPEGKVVPGVAESWDISTDGTSYTFHLRDNAQWSNGEAVTAQDFVYAWQRALNPATQSSHAFILYPVKNAENIARGAEPDLNALGIRAADARTVEVTLENPTPYFLELTAFPTAMPVPQHVIETHGEQWTRPEHFVSNGAYRLRDWQPQAHIRVQKSPTYWDAANVAIDTVVFITTEDRRSALKRYRANELDIIQSPPPAELPWLKENLADELHIFPTLGVYYYGFNLDAAPFKDNLKLREALTLAIDRQVIVEKISRGEQIPAYNLIPAATQNALPYQPDYARLSQDERADKARQLYAEAGYNAEHPLNITLTYNTNNAHKTIAAAIAEMWQHTLGVKATPENREWQAMLDSLKHGEVVMWRYGWQGDYNDPYTFLEPLQSTAELNHVHFHNAEFDGKLKQANATADLHERAQILHDAEKILIDSFALAPIYHTSAIYVIKPSVKGYKANALKRIPSKYLRIEP